MVLRLQSAIALVATAILSTSVLSLIIATTETWQANAFGQIKRDAFDDPSDAGGFGRTYLGFVTTITDDPYIEIEFDDIDDNGSSTLETPGGWMAFSQHYFHHCLDTSY